MTDGDRKYIDYIAHSKVEHHKNAAKMPYEEKVKIIVRLQEIELEIMKRNKRRKNANKLREIWELRE